MWNIISLDLDIKKKNHHFIEVNQADDVCFNAKFYNNGQPMSLVDGEDTIIINYANANGTITGDASIGKTMSASGAMIYLPRNCTNSHGTAHMQITINTNKTYVTNKQTTSFPIDIKICRSVVDGKEVSKNINSMIDGINKATIEGNKVINNIKDTADKYPPSSQLYSDVEDLKVRKYGAENLLKDSCFNGSIGEGFCWKNANSDTVSSVTYAPSLKGGNYVTLSSTTVQPGILQTVDTGNKLKDSYTISLRVYGTSGNIVYISLHGAATKNYTLKNTNTWEDVIFTFTGVSSWDKQLIIFGTAKSTFLITEVALWEGKNAFSFKPNSKDCLYDRIKISGKDVLDINYSGKYAGVGCINNPLGDTGTWFYYDIDVHSTTYKKIVAKTYHNNTRYENTMNNGTWSGWINKSNLSSYTQDSTHRFVTDAEKSLWNKYTRVFKQSFNNVTNVTVSCSSNVTSDHVVADFFIGNKENVTDFSWKVNNTVIRTEAGGGVVILHIDFGRTSTNTWIYRITGKIEITSTGEYTIDHIGTITGTTEITSLGLATNGTDNFNCCSAIIKKY